MVKRIKRKYTSQQASWNKRYKTKMRIAKQSNENTPSHLKNIPLDSNTAHPQIPITCEDDQGLFPSFHDREIGRMSKRHVVLEANMPYCEEGKSILNKERKAKELSLPVREVEIIEMTPTFVSTKSFSVEEASKMKVKELKMELKKRDLPIYGKKTELLSRLIDAINSNGDIVQDSIFRSTSGDICINVHKRTFQFIDVPGDGDCFFTVF